MSFADRHVIVTGGTGALGIAVVGALLAAGATCHVPFRADAEAEAYPHRDNARVKLLRAGDLADPAEAERFYGSADKLWGAVHLAGGFSAGPLVEASPENLRGQIDTNLMTCLMGCRAAVAAMSRTGQGGRIVNVAARPALEWRQGAGMVAYAASKAAVAALTVALAEEVAAQGIWVNAVAPSIMDTPANRKAMPKADTAAWPKVEEVAATILFLVSPGNRVTRGAIVPVYGKS
jgi:NAD(P)-dependent dehydrogenase (short-subunit alcohol dehydrogenase family)